MACSLLGTLILNRWQPFTGNSSLLLAKGALATTIVTTIGMVYLCLFGVGKILLHQPGTGMLLLVGSAVCAVLLYRGVVQNFKVESQEVSSSP